MVSNRGPQDSQLNMGVSFGCAWLRAALQLSEHLEEQSFGTMKNKYVDLEINLPVESCSTQMEQAYIIYVSFLILLPRFGALCKRTYIN